MNERRSVLLTGGTGFIGTHLGTALRSSGADVHLLLRKDSNVGPISKQYSPSNLHLYDGSVESLSRTLLKVQPTTIFHLASAIVAEHQAQDTDLLISGNLLFGTHLLEAMRISKTTRLVNTGSFWQHYHSDTERPSCLYAATKHAFQDILSFYTDAYGIRAVTLKLFDTYGPNDRRRKLFRILRTAAETGETLAVSGGEQQMDLVFADDVVSAFRITESRLCSGMDNPHELFGVPTGRRLSLRQVIETFEEVFSIQLRIDWGARPYRDREVMTCWDGHPILPGWSPRFDLATGLRKMLEVDGPISRA